MTTHTARACKNTNKDNNLKLRLLLYTIAIKHHDFAANDKYEDLSGLAVFDGSW